MRVMFIGLIGLGLGLVGAGCASSPVVVRVPLDGRTSTIARSHRAREREHGLPPATLTNWVSLRQLDAVAICFDVVLHDLAPLSLTAVHAQLEVPGQAPLDQAALWPQEPLHREVPGVVLEHEQHGFHTECGKQDHAGICLTYETKPAYRAVKHAAQLSVDEARGRMCYPNASYVTSATTELHLSVATAGGAIDQYRWRLAH